MGIYQKPTGEPFELRGRRLHFTDWHYVRPCGFGWFDDAGKNVSVIGDVAPDAAHFATMERPYGIRIEAQPARRMGPVLHRERPWEMNRLLFDTVIQEGGTYRAWCTSGAEQVKNDMTLVDSYFCYLESDDGLEWKRPGLSLHTFKKTKKTNILGTRGGTVFIDPSARAAERYKWVTVTHISKSVLAEYQAARPDAWDMRCIRTDVADWSDKYPEGIITAVLGAVSPDGLKWKQIARPLVVEHTDTQLVAYHDDRLEKYVLYTRFWPQRVRSPRFKDARSLSWIGERRSIGRAEADDFRRFPLSQPALEPGPDLGPSEVYYTNTRTATPGNPDQHLMFPTVWDTSNDQTRILLYSSHDGRAWQRVPGPAVFETGPFGQWDGGCIFSQPNLIELRDGSYALPYAGYNVPHKYPRGQFQPHAGYAIWPHGRLSAIVADELGQFSTYAVMDPGRELRLNVRTHRGGSIKVELAPLDRQTLPGRSFDDCRPIVGDHPAAPVTWNGETDMKHEPGSAVILRFQLDQARIYSVEFA